MATGCRSESGQGKSVEGLTTRGFPDWAVGMALMKSRRGAVDPVTLTIVAVCAILAVPNWRPWNWGKPKPPSAELVAAQGKQADAEAKAKALAGQLAAIQAANEAKKSEQLAYTHEMVTGAIEANSKAPESTERAITDSFLQRADIGFNTAIGKLDPALREEVIGIVAQLRSGDLAKIEAAKAMLAEKDKELAESAKARTELAAAKTVTEQKLVVAEADRLKKTETVTKLTAEVVTYANKSYAKEQEAGSLGATVEKLFWGLGILVGAYVLIHVLLPLWAQSYPQIGWLQKVAALGKNLTTSHV